MKREAGLLIGSALFFVGGWVSRFLSAAIKKGYTDKFAVWVKAEGVVTGISVQRFGVEKSSSRAFYPRYRFTYEGRDYSGTSSCGVGEGDYHVGQHIEVLVNPENPEESDVPHYFRFLSMRLSPYDIFIYVLKASSFGFFAVGILFALMYLFGT